MMREPVRYAGVGDAACAPPSGRLDSWSSGTPKLGNAFATARPVGTAAASTPRTRLCVRICILERTRPRSDLFRMDTQTPSERARFTTFDGAPRDAIITR